MEIRWMGHACFYLVTDTGLRILTDPFDQKVGYPLPRVEADVVTVSHEHFDHNSVELLPGRPRTLRGPGEFRLEGLTAYGVASYHDESQGSQRGPNTIFVLETDDLRLAHLGDLGHILNEEHLAALGQIDVLMVPVGGVYTVGPAEARRVVEQIGPRVVLPMHYKTPALTFPLAPVEDFLEGLPRAERCGRLALSRPDLPGARTVFILDSPANL